MQAVITLVTHGDGPPERAHSLAPQEWQSAFAGVVSGMPADGAQLLPGLTLGDTSSVSESLNMAMRTASLTHLTAVSGANCAIVTACVMALAALAGFPRWLRALSGGLSLVGFVMVVGLQPSVVRAAVMAGVVLVAVAFGRRGVGIPVLSFAVCVLLIIFPAWSLAPGFILSVAATAAIVTLAPPLAARFVEMADKILPSKLSTSLGSERWRNLALVLAVPLSAQLVCQPILMLLTPAWPTYGVLANMLTEPAAPVATVLGMITFVLSPLTPWLAHVAAWLAWVPAQWIGLVARAVNQLPFASIPWLDGTWGFLGAAVASGGITLAILTRRSSWRRAAVVVVALTVGLAAVVAATSSLASAITRPTAWRIAMCDVGQGDAFLIRGFENTRVTHTVLVDTGRHPFLVERCLSSLGISKLDLAVLTHFDQDHAGGSSVLFGKASTVLISAPQRAGDEWVIRDLAAHGITVVRALAGQQITLGDTTCEILWPAPGHPDMQGGNPGSISLRVRTPNFSGMFLADLGEDAQDALLAKYPALTGVDILKVAHHGSADQSASLTTRLHPRLALVSVGRDNGYGHPTAKILRLLTSLGSTIVRTDRQGLVLISSDGNNLSVWHEKADLGAG